MLELVSLNSVELPETSLYNLCDTHNLSLYVPCEVRHLPVTFFYCKNGLGHGLYNFCDTLSVSDQVLRERSVFHHKHNIV